MPVRRRLVPHYAMDVLVTATTSALRQDIRILHSLLYCIAFGMVSANDGAIDMV